MSAFVHLPLGQRIPNMPHAVSCSLPTLRAVRGYEEKDPAITQHLTSGYPRFVVHPFARELGKHYLMTVPALAGRKLWLTSSARMADGLMAQLGGAASAGQPQRFTADGAHGVSHRDDPGFSQRAKTFLQNIGGFISSREAEDHLVRLGLRSAVQPEDRFVGDALAETRRHLRRVLPTTGDADLLLTNCGMSAMYAAFRAVAEMQAARGRTVWIQLGWLYLDTIAILKRFTQDPADYVYVRDALDHEALERIFRAHGAKIAGVVAELPTNPLIQTPNLPALSALCRQHGVRLILDPSVVSVYNLDVLGYADVITGSLTKYTASDGDVTAGLVALNPASPDADQLRPRLAAEIEPLYSRDLARLALQIGRTETVLRQIHANTFRVVEYLEKQPAVKDVFWALHPASRENYLRISRVPEAVGGMISFTLRGPMEPFYDRLRMAKGPSFGMTTTLICPFMYLAHYDLVTTPAGIAELSASRLDPDLLRLCVGTEPIEEIIEVLAEAFV